MQSAERGQDSAETTTDVLGVTLYQSKERQAIIEFCGWFQNRQKNSRKNKKLEERCQSINKQEAHVRGGDMRACVMAAAHFEFQLANSMLAMSDSKQQRRRFNENQTNLNLFQKLLGQLSKLLDV